MSDPGTMPDRETVLESIIRNRFVDSVDSVDSSSAALEKSTSEWVRYQQGTPPKIVDGIWYVKKHGEPIHGVSMKRDDQTDMLKVRCSTNQ